MQSPSITPIETDNNAMRQYDSFAISDIHGDPETFGNALEHAKLIDRYRGEWIPTAFGTADTTVVTINGDTVGRGYDVFGVIRRIIELRNNNMHITVNAGNHELAMLQALLHGGTSKGLNNWVHKTGYTLAQEIHKHFSDSKEKPFEILSDLVTKERGEFFDVLGHEALTAAQRYDDVLYIHALPNKQWMEHFDTGGILAMNIKFKSLMTREHIHTVARKNGALASIFWQHEEDGDNLDEEVTHILQRNGIRHVVRGHDHQPKITEQSNNVRTITTGTGSKLGGLKPSGFNYFYAARNGETTIVSDQQ